MVVVKNLYLQLMDIAWMRHLEDMDWLKDSVKLRAYANLDPLIEYKKESKVIFQEMMQEIIDDVKTTIQKISVASTQDHVTKVGRRILKS